MTHLNKDLAAGLIFIAIGGFFALDAWFHLRIGRALSMGPGYFPVILGGLLAALGASIAASGLRHGAAPIGTIPWRGLVLVLGAILVFSATVRGAGLAPALAISILMAARAPKTLGWTASLTLALLLTIFCLLVFVKGLGLPYPIFGRWLGA
jgi:hypothetical protein